MSSAAITVENLAKQYQIGAQNFGYRTLRETLATSLATTLKSLQVRQRNTTETFWALKDVSLSVNAGEVVGIVGRNGAGKSTLLKILSRITEPTRGRIRLRGRMASLLEVGTGFHAELSGRENVFLNGAILGMTRREILSKFDEIVSFAEVEQFIDTPVKRYSSGMYLRLAFAVAAHLEPEILVVDEVLAVGDASFQKRCLGKMQDVANQGRTVLFVSHNMAAVSKLCQRAIWLARGTVIADGPANTIVRRYLDNDDLETEIGPLWRPAEQDAGAEGVSILRALVRADGPEPCANIPFEAPLNIDVEYTLRSPVRGIAIVYRITDSNGHTLLTSWDTDGPSAPPDLRMPGRYMASCPLPPLTFRPGSYTVAVGIRQHCKGWLQYEENALSFRITPQGYRLNESRNGILTPVFDWHTGSIESG